MSRPQRGYPSPATAGRLPNVPSGPAEGRPSEPTAKLAEEPSTRPWEELRTSGLLWLINAALLHPRGFAMAIVLDADGKAIGWQLLGDGSEPWQFGDDIDEPFQRVEETLSARRSAVCRA